jgi:protein-S-isoprenylcysteine O-methyltransferase Ste14
LSVLELKIPPVAVTALFAILMWLLARATPALDMGLDLPASARLTALALIATAAAIIGLAAVRAFHRASTTVNPLSPQGCTALVTSGVFRYSRNPMYLALLMALLGWGLYLANPLSMLLALAFVPWMNRFQIQPEERMLQRVFGQAFENYCRRVRRWL